MPIDSIKIDLWSAGVNIPDATPTKKLKEKINTLNTLSEYVKACILVAHTIARIQGDIL